MTVAELIRGLQQLPAGWQVAGEVDPLTGGTHLGIWAHETDAPAVLEVRILSDESIPERRLLGVAE